MKPILTSQQIREADQYTIQHEPISSLDLMERASIAFVKQFIELCGRGKSIFVFCGTGNNGGDGLAVSRLLKEKGFDVTTYVIGDQGKGSPDFLSNIDRLSSLITIKYIQEEAHFPELNDSHIAIDALFGSGLSRKIEGVFGSLVNHINHSNCDVYAVDIASGLFSDVPTEGGAIIRPKHTISFQVPKLAFLMPDTRPFVGDWHIADIGLDQKFIQSQETFYFYSEIKDFTSILPKRGAFMHKGKAGRVQLFAGKVGSMGAAILCAKATLRTGSGLTYIHSPTIGRDVLQVTVPEAMVIPDEHQEIITQIEPLSGINAVAIGPGIGTNKETSEALRKGLTTIKCPLVIDADGINILAKNSESLLNLLPQETILTPHPGEFERLVGSWDNDFEKINLLRNFCRKHKVNVVLKGAYSSVCSSSGDIYFNCSGNPGMATAGSGDVLTGIIVSLLGQGLKSFDALKLGVFIHGLSGDLGIKDIGEYSLIASDIINYLPNAFKKIQSFQNF